MVMANIYCMIPLHRVEFSVLIKEEHLLLKFNHNSKHWTKGFTCCHFPQENSWAGRGQITHLTPHRDWVLIQLLFSLKYMYHLLNYSVLVWFNFTRLATRKPVGLNKYNGTMFKEYFWLGHIPSHFNTSIMVSNNNQN